ncbi:MAG TPA: hypothetical protein VGJ00_01175 [Rhabdochlamydiaceae bacterium]|jgi:hypothetical protein
MMPILFLFLFGVFSLFTREGAASGLCPLEHAYEDRDTGGKDAAKRLIDSHDIKDRLAFFILQDLLQKRLERSIALNSAGNSRSGYAAIVDAFSEDAQIDLFHEIENITLVGFSNEEFQDAKEGALNRLNAFLLNSSSAFLTASKNTLNELCLEDLSPYWITFLEYYFKWENIKEEELLFHFADYAIDQTAYPFLIENAHPHSIDLFYQLPLNEKEKKLITQLVTTIAEKSIWGLLFKKKELERIGKKINHVHPMRFMGYILSEPKLKKHLKEIKTSSFKWDHFIDGFADRMKEENAKNNLSPYIPGMAHLLKVHQSHILDFVHSKDYEGLVKSLI